jgi:hypothetical protein
MPTIKINRLSDTSPVKLPRNISMMEEKKQEESLCSSIESSSEEEKTRKVIDIKRVTIDSRLTFVQRVHTDTDNESEEDVHLSYGSSFKSG